MRQIAIVAASLMLTAGLVAQAPKPQTAAQVQAGIQGTWVVQTFNGQPSADGGEISITITGDKYAQSVNGAVNERGTFKIDPAKKPMTIDLTIQEGEDAGKLQLGIIELAGDKMTCKLAAPATTTRPTNLASVEEGFFLVVAARKK